MDEEVPASLALTCVVPTTCGQGEANGASATDVVAPAIRVAATCGHGEDSGAPAIGVAATCGQEEACGQGETAIGMLAAVVVTPGMREAAVTAGAVIVATCDSGIAKGELVMGIGAEAFDRVPPGAGAGIIVVARATGLPTECEKNSTGIGEAIFATGVGIVM